MGGVVTVPVRGGGPVEAEGMHGERSEGGKAGRARVSPGLRWACGRVWQSPASAAGIRRRAPVTGRQRRGGRPGSGRGVE